MRISTVFLLTVALLALGACAAPEPVVEPAAPTVPAPQAAGLDHQGDGDLSGHAPLPEAPWASRRRMTVDQLNASIRAVTGGIGWEDGNGNDLFEELSGTLGKPDFIDSTMEDLTVSLLFQKFLGDAARDVCTQLSDREIDPGSTADPVLFLHAGLEDTVETNPAGIDQNLQALLLRFHGQSVPLDSERLNPWRWLFTSSVHVTGDPVVAWRAVCVGLLTHPDFYSY